MAHDKSAASDGQAVVQTIQTIGSSAQIDTSNVRESGTAEGPIKQQSLGSSPIKSTYVQLQAEGTNLSKIYQNYSIHVLMFILVGLRDQVLRVWRNSSANCHSFILAAQTVSPQMIARKRNPSLGKLKQLCR